MNLKPCPFCNSKDLTCERYGLPAKLFNSYKDDNGGNIKGGFFYSVGCPRCGAYGPTDKNKNKAIEKWNNYFSSILGEKNEQIN